jgi:hypothetical protein
MADANYLVPVITGAATIIGAAIGFGSATLKHHWDIQDDERRWNREQQEQRRVELRTTFNNYLLHRDTVVSATRAALRPGRTQKNVDAVSNAVDSLLRTKNELALLDAESLSVVLEDLQGFSPWMQAGLRKITERVSDEPLPNPPSGDAVLARARKVLG